MKLSRSKSLIKPPPPRLSWELLLEDYLKDPNPTLSRIPNIPPSSTGFDHQSPHNELLAPEIPIQSSFIPSPYPPPPPPSGRISSSKSTLPPRRYQMTLDELVYLISQVGRADLYREMVQYVKAQKSSLSSKYSPSLSPSPIQQSNQAVNFNAHPSQQSMDSLTSNEEINGETTTTFSTEVQDELIRKLHRLTMKPYR